MLKNAYSWMGNKVHSPYANWVLGILFYLEAIFFLPTDPMLIMYCVEKRNNALHFALIATICSVLGGITGYYIGAYCWNVAGEQIIHNQFVQYLIKPKTFYYLRDAFQSNRYLTLLLAGIPPIPYKAATLTAGFCKLPLIPFVLCSIVVRGGRFFLLALIIRRWGIQIKEYVDRYLIVITIMVCSLLLGLWIFK